MSDVVRSTPPRAAASSLRDPRHAVGDEALSDARRTFERAIVLAVVTIPFCGFVAAIALLWGRGIDVTQLAILLAMYTLTGFGITMGFHRLFTHRAFRTTRAARLLIAILGSMAAEGPVILWTAVHRRHHQFSDREGDPHSPHLRESSVRGLLRGLWHAHAGWLFVHKTENLLRYAPDLLRDTDIIQVDRLFFVWIVLGLAIPGAIGGLLTGSWSGAALGILWGGLVRTFLVHHATWSINSICHVYGSRPFQTRDQSTNNLICALLSFGEGWHNNHHAFPSSARHGLAWWQVDFTYALICLLGRVGLAWDIRVPESSELAAKQNVQVKVAVVFDRYTVASGGTSMPPSTRM